MVEFADEFARFNKMGTLEAAAVPFELIVHETGTGITQMALRSRDRTGFARRDISLKDMRETSDPMGLMLEKISEMKMEIGYKPDIPTRTDIPVVKQNKRLECPEHGNFLIPAEKGVLKCPVRGCKRKARKKNRDDSPPPAPEAVTDVTPVAAAEIVRQQEARVLGEDKGAKIWIDLFAPPGTPNKMQCSDDKLRSTEEYKHFCQGLAQGRKELQTVPGGFKPNDRRPRLHSDGQNFYLIQSTGDIEVWIDVTSIITDVRTNINSSMSTGVVTETALTLQV